MPQLIIQSETITERILNIGPFFLHHDRTNRTRASIYNFPSLPITYVNLFCPDQDLNSRPLAILPLGTPPWVYTARRFTSIESSFQVSNRVTFTAIVPGATPYGDVKCKGVGGRKKLQFPTNISLYSS